MFDIDDEVSWVSQYDNRSCLDSITRATENLLRSYSSASSMSSMLNNEYHSAKKRERLFYGTSKIFKYFGITAAEKVNAVELTFDRSDLLAKSKSPSATSSLTNESTEPLEIHYLSEILQPPVWGNNNLQTPENIALLNSASEQTLPLRKFDSIELATLCKTSPASSKRQRLFNPFISLFESNWLSSSAILENEIFSPKTHRETFQDVPTIESMRKPIRKHSLNGKESRSSLKTVESEKVKNSLHQYLNKPESKQSKPTAKVNPLSQKIVETTKSCLSKCSRRLYPLHVRFSSPLEKTPITLINNDQDSTEVEKTLNLLKLTPSPNCTSSLEHPLNIPDELGRLYESIHSLGISIDDL